MRDSFRAGSRMASTMGAVMGSLVKSRASPAEIHRAYIPSCAPQAKPSNQREIQGSGLSLCAFPPMKAAPASGCHVVVFEKQYNMKDWAPKMHQFCFLLHYLSKALK
jgi:hypothetical protein